MQFTIFSLLFFALRRNWTLKTSLYLCSQHSVPLGMMMAMKSQKGPITWKPLQDLKFSTSRQWILPGESSDGIVKFVKPQVESKVRFRREWSEVRVGIELGKGKIGGRGNPKKEQSASLVVTQLEGKRMTQANPTLLRNLRRLLASSQLFRFLPYDR